MLGDRVVRIEHAGLDVGARAAREADRRHRARGARFEPTSRRTCPDLEAAGYRVVIREPEWFEHRVFKGPDTNVNLHTFTAGCEEVDTMLLFRDHLRESAEDRELYARTKRELAAYPWKYVQQYADAKTAVVQEIMERARARSVG